MPFLDHLGPYFLKHDPPIVDGKLIQQAHEQVLSFCKQFKDSKNGKLAFRYAALKNYFEDRLASGGSPSA
jgi:hypothetical protein